MGFLSNLLGNSAKKLASTAAQSAVDAVSDELNRRLQKDARSSQNVSSPMEKAVSGAADVPEGYGDLGAYAPVRKKIRRVLQKEFPQYEVREEVSPVTLGGTGRFMPYSFGVYENGSPKLFIMLADSNTCAMRTYRWSKEEAARAGVPMINFVTAFENEIGYIISRLHQYL